MNIKDLVKDNTVKFVRFKEGNFIYKIESNHASFEFPVPLKEIDGAEMKAEDKAIIFMKWIRNHLATLY